jgi:hypothetical protein
MSESRKMLNICNIDPRSGSQLAGHDSAPNISKAKENLFWAAVLNPSNKVTEADKTASTGCLSYQKLQTLLY